MVDFLTSVRTNLEAKLRPIALRTLEEAKERKKRLAEEAFQCHDDLIRKQQELPALESEEELLRKQILRLKALQCPDVVALMEEALEALQRKFAACQQEVDSLSEQRSAW